jgi:hypothetical protein
MRDTSSQSDTRPTHLHLGRRFGDVRPSPEADEELTWFFNEALVAVERPSEQGRLLSGDRRDDGERLDARVEALRAARKIWGRLKHVGDRDARVLQALYTERRWPRELARKWGHVVGVVEAMPGASRRDAAIACARALAAYERARGNSPSVAPKEDR